VQDVSRETFLAPWVMLGSGGPSKLFHVKHFPEMDAQKGRFTAKLFHVKQFYARKQAYPSGSLVGGIPEY
jgi:hypothetical protein